MEDLLELSKNPTLFVWEMKNPGLRSKTLRGLSPRDVYRVHTDQDVVCYNKTELLEDGSKHTMYHGSYNLFNPHHNAKIVVVENLSHDPNASFFDALEAYCLEPLIILPRACGAGECKSLGQRPNILVCCTDKSWAQDFENISPNLTVCYLTDKDFSNPKL